MTKAERCLRILVMHTLADDPVWAELRAKGHTVDMAYSDSTHTVAGYDLVLGPQCWQLHAPLLKYVPVAIQAARRRRKGGKDATPKLYSSDEA